MKAFALTAMAFAMVATGCGGGGGTQEQASTEVPAATQEPLAHADAVNVTYYYLPG